MTKYVLVFTGGGMPETEEESAKVMEAWGAWYGKLGEAVVDGGNPFGPAKSVASNGSVSDVPQGTMATGYTILKADSLGEATEMAKGCPILESNGEISVYETIEM